jgi:hypothetical protein
LLETQTENLLEALLKNRSLIVLAALLSFPLAAAQFGPPDPKLLEKYKGWFDLQATVNTMLEVDKQTGLAFNKDQAKKAIPILKDIGNRVDLKPKDASDITIKLENEVPNTKQLTWMDSERLKRAEERRKNNGRPNFAGGFPNAKFIAMIQAMQQGKPFNPFRDGPSEDDLKKLIGLLEKR